MSTNEPLGTSSDSLGAQPKRDSRPRAGTEPRHAKATTGRRTPAVGLASLSELPAAASAQLRGLRAIELLATQPRTAAELARMMEINRSTALRLLQELESSGYVERNSETKAYSPVSSWLWGILAKSNDQYDISEMLAPVLSKFREEYGEAMAYAVPAGGAMVYVLYFASRHHIALREQLGTVRSMHCSALGKAYLSGLNPVSLDTELGQLDYKDGTPRAAHGPLELRQRVLAASELGFALDYGETFEGSACVAVPLRVRGKLVGAVGCQGPESRLSEELLSEIGTRLAHELGGAL